MYRCKFIFLLIALINAFAPLSASGQDIDLTDLIETEEESDDQTELLEYLQWLIQHPIDLNSATARQLETLPWLSPTLSRKIIEYRNTAGRLSRIEQLLSIPALTPDIFHKIRPFLCIRERVENPFQLVGRQRLIFPEPGADAKNFLGSNEKTYNRIDGLWGQTIQFGLLAEKDSGERVWNDLQSNYLNVSVAKRNINILLGNYMAEFGQGLVFWGPYRLHKGYNAIAPAKARPRGLRPYRSVNENASLFGVAMSFKSRFFMLNTFVSQDKRDANISQDTVRSFIDTGYHRTAKELSHRDAMNEKLIGMNLSFSVPGNSQLGVTYQASTYDKTLLRGNNGLTAFSGRREELTGVNWDMTFGPINFFGEAARSHSRAQALVAGCWLDAELLSVTMVWRKFDRDYFNRHGYAFGNRGAILNNEKGFYWGCQLGLWRGSKISFYLDNAYYPWPKTTAPMPSSERQAMATIEQKLGKNLRVQLSVKSRSFECSENVNDKWGNPVKRMIVKSTPYYRGQMTIKFSDDLRLRTRMEWRAANTNPLSLRIDTMNDTSGVLFYQDVHFNLTPTVRFSTRWTFFDAPTFDVRFYQYENDLPGIMRLKLLYSRGTRWYFVTGVHVLPSITFSLKYEYTWYDRMPSTSDSSNTADHRQAFSVQLDWQR